MVSGLNVFWRSKSLSLLDSDLHRSEGSIEAHTPQTHYNSSHRFHSPPPPLLHRPQTPRTQHRLSPSLQVHQDQPHHNQVLRMGLLYPNLVHLDRRVEVN